MQKRTFSALSGFAPISLAATSFLPCLVQAYGAGSQRHDHQRRQCGTAEVSRFSAAHRNCEALIALTPLNLLSTII